MRNLLKEFRYRRTFLYNMNYQEADSRLSSFLDWLESEEETAKILAEITDEPRVAEMLKKSDYNNLPSARSPEDVVLLGLHFLREVKSGKSLWGFSHVYGIRPSYKTNSIQVLTEEVFTRYIEPAIDFVGIRLEESVQQNNKEGFAPEGVVESPDYPPEIRDSLQSFQKDHSDSRKTAFLMMRFGETPAHRNIVEAIRQVLAKNGIVALRADDKEYHSSLLSNVLTYIYGCSMGVAVFERIEADRFNPNVSFEVGYMRALHKPICLLKDRTMHTLQTDLLGELYKSFDPQDPKGSIPPELEKWLRDKGVA